MLAAGLAAFGLGIVVFYLNFLYRGLGFDDRAIGALVAAQASGVVLGAVPGARFAGGHTRRASLLLGGTVTAAGLVGVITQSEFAALAVSAALIGAGGMLASTSGAALLADASSDLRRFRVFGQQIAIATLAAFAASAIAGGLAAPIAAALGLAEGDPRAIRTLLALGTVLAGLSALPVLALHGARVPRLTLPATSRRVLLTRFVPVALAFGFGAGSFLPFINLFVADRFGVPFAALGIVLGALAIAGSAGAILHGQYVVGALGPSRGAGATMLASLPFALIAALVPALPLAAGLLAARAALAYGSSATFTAYTLAAFTPAERVGVSAAMAIAYSGAAAVGSVVSGLMRAQLGNDGWTVNLAMLAGGYAVAAVLQLRMPQTSPA